MWELWSGGKTPYPTFTNPQVLDEVMSYTLLCRHACMYLYRQWESGTVNAYLLVENWETICV